MTSLISASTVQLDIQSFQSKVDLSKSVQGAEKTPQIYEKYTYRYRYLKTALMIVAWISFGMNNEIIATTYEDLRVLLNLNYNGFATALVLQSVGMLITMFFSGYLYDKFSNYSELLMAVSGFFVVAPNYVIPIADNSLVCYMCFFIRGSASAIWDIGGNHIILGVWEGISTSPLNAMHAGYGIGGILAVQLSKPFIKFDTSTSSNTSSPQLTPNEITIQTPYFIVATIGLILVAAFIIAQLVESSNRHVYQTKIDNSSPENTTLNQKQLSGKSTEISDESSFIKNLFFSGRTFKGQALCYMSTQISLITVMFFFLAGYIAIISKFLLTYLTKGPAQMTIDEYTSAQTLYWAVYVLARFMTAFLAFRINPVAFVGGLFIANAAVCGLFLVVPYLNGSAVFYWILMVLMGVTSGPMQPSSFMAAKKFLCDYNTFIMSVFSIGIALGSILFQELAGRLLDYFERAEVVAYLFFGTSVLVVVLFLPINFIYIKFVGLVSSPENENEKS